MIAWLLVPIAWVGLSVLAFLVMLGAHALRHRDWQRHLRQRMRPF